LPGRDKNDFMDTTGRFSIILAIAGIFIHGFARFFSNNIKLDKPMENLELEKSE
jgi:flagellar biogenesis protein FliO